MITEAEAKTKWCPLIRREKGNNISTGPLENVACIASRCMFWREVVKDIPYDSQNRNPLTGAPVMTKTVGYCGAAGKPE